MAGLDLRYVTEAVHARATEWEHTGAHWSLTIGSERNRPAASITCETDRVRADLTIQADGDATIQVINQLAALTSRYHYRLATADDVAACLDELTRQLLPPA